MAQPPTADVNWPGVFAHLYHGTLSVSEIVYAESSAGSTVIASDKTTVDASSQTCKSAGKALPHGQTSPLVATTHTDNPPSSSRCNSFAKAQASHQGIRLVCTRRIHRPLSPRLWRRFHRRQPARRRIRVSCRKLCSPGRDRVHPLSASRAWA